MKKITMFILSVMLFAGGSLFARVHYVTPTGNGNQDGSSWENASNDLQLIMDNAQEGDSVFVAAGTYIPLRTADNTSVKEVNRKNAFVLRKNVHLFGGFKGTETRFSERDWCKNETVLSGKLNDSDKTYHVIISAGDVGRAIVDGFKITEGNGDVDGESMAINEATIKHKDGAGININRASSPIIRNCTVVLNDAMGDGAGIFINANSTPLIENVVIDNNAANAGGGIMVYQQAEPIIKNCLIVNNSSNLEGGGIRVFDALPSIINCTVVNNSASNYGGVFANKGINIDNTIIWRNTGNNQLAFDVAVSSVNFSLVEDQNPAGTRNLNGREVYPDFVDMDNDNYQLKEGSVCIDRGDSEAYEAIGNLNTDLDLSGGKRLVGNDIDLGAYEYGSLTSIHKIQETEVTVYPNPAKNFINLSAVPVNSTIKVLDLNGRVLDVITNPSESYQLNFNLNSGVYFIKIESGEETVVKKIIVE